MHNRPRQTYCPAWQLPNPSWLPFSGPGPNVPPLITATAAADRDTGGSPRRAPRRRRRQRCPGAAGLRGGWKRKEDPAADVGLHAAAKFVLASVGPADHVFHVTAACTQVVAGSNTTWRSTCPAWEAARRGDADHRAAVYGGWRWGWGWGSGGWGLAPSSPRFFKKIRSK